MSNPFQQLKDVFKNLGTNVTDETKTVIQETLNQWLKENGQQIANQKPEAEYNGTIMQYFHWYSNGDGNHWKNLYNQIPEIVQAGFSALWLPPAYKGLSQQDVGYGVYDIFDLGEFDQKGGIRTKYGTKEEYVQAIKKARESGLNIYADVVFNHKMGADSEEEFDAIPFDPNDRNRPIGFVEKIKSWTNFQFPGRGSKYSDMKWHWWHFDSVDYNSLKPNYKAVYQINGKSFESKVDLRNGNFDYLMGCDLDMNHIEVRKELKFWGEWIIDQVGVDGFRLDAIKHIQGDFFSEWLDHLEHYAKRNLFCVGEYWTEDLATLNWYIGNTAGRMCLFDVPLHYNFHRASKSGGHYDMRTILDNTLMKTVPLYAVTFVDNHDTQPLQALESVVENWFKPIAYSIILLRAEGYPCVFYPDYYGSVYKDKGKDGNVHEVFLDSHKTMLDKLLYARNHYAYGEQYDYFDHPNLIGWTRIGTKHHPNPMAVILSDGSGGKKWMEVKKINTQFVDITENSKEIISTNEHGWGEFACNGGSVSVWIPKYE